MCENLNIAYMTFKTILPETVQMGKCKELDWHTREKYFLFYEMLHLCVGWEWIINYTG